MGIPRLEPLWTEVKTDYWLNLIKTSARDQLAGNLERPKRGTKISNDAAMFLAYAEALRGAGEVAPNPMVGAVLLDRNSLYLSSGAHLRVGGDHAEVEVIKQVGSPESLDGAHLFVTLEPCSHHGRTPPCADMIARTGISDITFGLKDPNPAVNGAGEMRLRGAGKKVQHLERWSGACEWLVRVFVKNQRDRKLFTAMKVASTASGVMAGENTSRLWITNERSRQMGHFLRLEYDAICIGARTALLDDPALDIRHPLIAGRTPLRIVVDGQGLLLKDMNSLKLLRDLPERSLVILPHGSPDFLEKKYGIRVLRLRLNQHGEFNWQEICQDLWAQGVCSLLLEGGARLYETALQQSAVDVLHWFISPKDRPSGLKWSVNSEAFEIYKKGGGIALEEDRLIEMRLGDGGVHRV